MRGGAAWSVLVTVTAVTSCIGSTRNDEASAGVSYLDFVPGVKRALCELEAKCNKNQPDADTCMAWNLGRLSLEGEPEGIGIDIECAADDVGAGRVMADPAEAQKCLDAIRTMPCGSPHYDYFMTRQLTKRACGKVLTGKVPIGGECRFIHRDCARGLECKGCIGNDCRGTCQPELPAPQPAHNGERCWVCDGVNCGYAACVDGWCDDLNGYVCEPKLPDGAQCPGGREAACAGGGCWNEMLGCFTAPNQIGAKCVLGGPTGCTGPLWCDLRTNTCVPYGGIGDACGPDDPPCAGRGSCVNGKCQFAPTGGVLGDSCTVIATPPPDVQYGSTCDGMLDCDMGTCIAHKPQCI